MSRKAIRRLFSGQRILNVLVNSMYYQKQFYLDTCIVPLLFWFEILGFINVLRLNKKISLVFSPGNKKNLFCIICGLLKTFFDLDLVNFPKNDPWILFYHLYNLLNLSSIQYFNLFDFHRPRKSLKKLWLRKRWSE